MNTGSVPCPECPPEHAVAGSIGKGWILAATVLGSSMEFIDGTVVNVALPSLQRSFGATGTQAQWVVEAYALFLASLLLVGGSLGDRLGLRRVFLLGVLLFTCASIWCGLAPSLTQLLVARALQGVAGALLVPNSLALLSSSYGDAERGSAIGTWSAFASMMTALGPVVGGWMVQHESWRWVFFLNVPLGLLTIWIVIAKTASVTAAKSRKTVDWSGALLGTAGLGAVTIALMEWNSGSLSVRLLSAVGALLLVLFLRRERRAENPIMPLDLFHDRTFSGANLLTFLLYAALSGVLFFLPLNLIQIQRYTPTQAGSAMLPLVVTLALLSPWTGKLADRYGARGPLTIGPLITACGYALLAVPGTGAPYWRSYLPAMIVLGIGMAISVAPLTTTVMNAVPLRRSGAASGINNAVSQTAALLALAIASPLFYQMFSEKLPGLLLANRVPTQAAIGVEAQAPLLGAIETPDMPARMAIDESFVSGFRLIALLGCGSAVGAGITASIFIRKKDNQRESAV